MKQVYWSILINTGNKNGIFESKQYRSPKPKIVTTNSDIRWWDVTGLRGYADPAAVLGLSKIILNKVHIAASWIDSTILSPKCKTRVDKSSILVDKRDSEQSVYR